jgi:DNA (cytosine-5)-methyltransferase 1
MIRIATVFSGIGSVEHALVRMGIPHEIVFAADIDKFARETYKANFEIKDDVFFEDVCAID